MRKLYLIGAAVFLLGLIAGGAMAQNFIIDPGFDGSTQHYGTYSTGSGEWYNVYIMGEPGLPWTSCNRFSFTNVCYGWSDVAAEHNYAGQPFYSPTDLAPGATGSIENIGGLIGEWNGEGSFFQDVYVQPGARYQFTGYYWADGEFGSTLSEGQIWVDSAAGFQKIVNTNWGSRGGANPREQMVTDGHTDLTGATQIVQVLAANPQWTPFSYVFTATSPIIGLGCRVNVGSAGQSTTNKSFYTDNWSLTPYVLPEPSSVLALGAGLFGLVGVIRRRR